MLITKKKVITIILDTLDATREERSLCLNTSFSQSSSLKKENFKNCYQTFYLLPQQNQYR